MPADSNRPLARHRIVLGGWRLRDGLRKIFQAPMEAKSVIATAGFALLAAGSAGCAVHYYDKSTGTEHLWGFGHLKMAVQPSSEGVRAVVKGTQTLGLGFGLGREDYFLSAGWNNQRILKVADNTSVRFEWPTADFFNVRVGTNFPPAYWTTNNPETRKP